MLCTHTQAQTYLLASGCEYINLARLIGEELCRRDIFRGIFNKHSIEYVDPLDNFQGRRKPHWFMKQSFVYFLRHFQKRKNQNALLMQNESITMILFRNNFSAYFWSIESFHWKSCIIFCSVHQSFPIPFSSTLPCSYHSCSLCHRMNDSLQIVLNQYIHANERVREWNRCK